VCAAVAAVEIGTIIESVGKLRVMVTINENMKKDQSNLVKAAPVYTLV